MTDQLKSQLESADGWATEVFGGHLTESHTRGFEVFFPHPQTVLSYVCYINREYPGLVVEKHEWSVEVSVPEEQ
ncbi:hypothetical protein [Synechococcus sp. PCC 7335]|uniref:hypothetical protein n=1 Tax=Synechococcus sp. (strain ATCC 29403 / PCC 7335) TaxID=91464 RepID=UPI00056E0666|nr:hypothetical protein [Synechococcus sp. PCC 7335]